jgi:hypothetical protein
LPLAFRPASARRPPALCRLLPTFDFQYTIYTNKHHFLLRSTATRII